ncbi:MAG: hypothetical protein JW860_03240 [Sedimentisphaerales bacterium]|nr:hypothetical protein [Sedimentisphaerales bacterium]
MAKKQKKQDLIALLGAYLDGELSDSQAEKLEKQLAQDPESQKLLDELRRISQSINRLPRIEAPSDLAEGVMNQLERDLLLDRSDVLAEMAGHKHLVWRRIFSAAAMIVFVGAIAVIFYNVFSKPQNGSVNRETISKVVATKETAKEKPAPVNAENASRAAPIVSVIKDKVNKIKMDLGTIPQIQYSHVCLIIKEDTASHQQTTLDNILDVYHIASAIQSKSPDHTRYSFVCYRDQFNHIFNDISRQARLDLVLSDDRSQAAIVVENITADQAMKIASEANPTIQLAYAMKMASTPTTPDLAEPMDFPQVFYELLAMGEPEFTELHTLGPRINQTRPAPQDDMPAQSIAANQPADMTPELTDSASPEQPAQKPKIMDSAPASDFPAHSQPAELVAVTLIVQNQ